MKVTVEPGTYVIGVSGGVDSVVLLDVLSRTPGIELVVAHFDHGIRGDSHQDAELVATLSQKYGWPFVTKRGHLGRGASEEKARQARYDFLRHVRKKQKARAIITAHHQDDALETLAFNVMRGTRRKGMSALQSTDEVLRPLLGYSKADILAYAREHNLQWREDSTNSDERYARNWIRRRLLPKLSREQKRELTQTYHQIRTTNREVDLVVDEQLRKLKLSGGLDRKKFIALPYSFAAEIMLAWLKSNEVLELDRKRIDILTVSAKTLPPGKKVSIDKQHTLQIEVDRLALA